MRTIEHWIDGAGTAGAATRHAPVWNPATGAQQAEVVLAEPADVDAAVAAATAAVDEAIAPVRVRRAGLAADRVPADWRERFVRAYDIELQEWVDAVSGDGELGPSSWDGYAATAVSDAGLRSLRTGERVPVSLGDRPALYEK